MEAFVDRIKALWGAAWAAAVPYLRQVLRFFALPYCFFFQVPWAECKRPRLQVAGDLLHIFFRLGYYPDNYGICRLFERDRDEWRYYLGSIYNPFLKSLLIRRLAPLRYQVLFEDKEVCHQLCRGAGLRTARLVGVMAVDESFSQFIAARAGTDLPARMVIKPAGGAAGSGLYVAERTDDGWKLTDARGRAAEELLPCGCRRVVEAYLQQHPDLSAVYAHSINTVRVMTMMKADGTPCIFAAGIRFGTGGNRADNWTLGGVATGIDLERGRLRGVALDKRSRPVDRHPDTGYVFDDFRLPMLEELRAFALRVQAAFPYYGMLGIDVALTTDGPALVEINAAPNTVGLEQAYGPILRDPATLREFARQGLLTRSMRRALAADISAAESVAPTAAADGGSTPLAVR